MSITAHQISQSTPDVLINNRRPLVAELRRALLPDDERDDWKIVTINNAGDCAFTTLAFAINSSRPYDEPVTVEDLRKLLPMYASHTYMSWQEILKMYISEMDCVIGANQKDSQAKSILSRYKSVKNSQQLEEVMMSSDHYATHSDIDLICRVYGMVPMVLNKFFNVRQRTVPDYMKKIIFFATGDRSLTHTLFQDAPNNDPPCVLMFFRPENQHYDIVIRLTSDKDYKNNAHLPHLPPTMFSGSHQWKQLPVNIRREYRKALDFPDNVGRFPADGLDDDDDDDLELELEFDLAPQPPVKKRKLVEDDADLEDDDDEFDLPPPPVCHKCSNSGASCFRECRTCNHYFCSGKCAQQEMIADNSHCLSCWMENEFPKQDPEEDSGSGSETVTENEADRNRKQQQQQHEYQSQLSIHVWQSSQSQHQSHSSGKDKTLDQSPDKIVQFIHFSLDQKCAVQQSVVIDSPEFNDAIRKTLGGNSTSKNVFISHFGNDDDIRLYQCCSGPENLGFNHALYHYCQAFGIKHSNFIGNALILCI